MPDRLREVKGLVVHCSASQWGDAAEIDAWHKARGWSGIGYHAVILNGFRGAAEAYQQPLDGKIEPGRDKAFQGAHCLARDMNVYTLGVCLIGSPGFWYPEAPAWPAAEGVLVRRYATGRQLSALVHWLATQCRAYGLDPGGKWNHPKTGLPVPVITQHSDHDPHDKPLCASLHLASLRRLVAQRLEHT